MRFKIDVHANGVTVTDTETGAIMFDEPSVSVTVHLDGHELELYDNLWLLQRAADKGETE